MKILSFGFLLSMALISVSCGNKDSGGSSKKNHFSSNSYSVQTVNCLMAIQTGVITCGNQVFPPSQVSQQSYQILSQAMMIAQQSNIQPVVSNGVSSYKIKITGSTSPYGTGYTQPTQNYSGSLILNVQQAVIYR